MPVYVDDMYRWRLGHFRGLRMSHMIADTDGELHAMADLIGIARRYYQGDHYDVCLLRRARAVDYGAVEITMRQCAAMARLRKLGMPLGDPDTAVGRMLVTKQLLSSGTSLSCS